MTGTVAASSASLSSTPTSPFLYLSPRGLVQLRAYKYVSAPLTSIVDQTMTHFWDFSVNLMPMWLAPNLITTFSFMHALLAHFLVQYYCPTLSESAPLWVYITVAVCMFLYQTFDALDGKQARRTKNGSPLGQLFDHGCDAVTATIMSIFVASTLRTGGTFLSYAILLMIAVPFFAANWEESVTSVFRFGIVGVTEGQFIIMGIELLSGIYGPGMWMTTLSELIGASYFALLPSTIASLLGDITLRQLTVLTSLSGGSYQIVSSVYVVYMYYRAHPNEDRRQAIVSFLQFCTVITLGGLWAASPAVPLVNYPRTMLIIVGSICSYQASRLIICHVTCDRFPTVFAIAAPLPFVVLNEYSALIGIGKGLDAHTVATVYAAYVAVVYAHFIYVTISQITSFLGIRCFHIKYVKAETTKAQ